MTVKEIIAILENGAQANQDDSCRKGNMILLHGPGDVIMTGDLHGHQLNFDKIIRYANLANNPNRHLVIHELIHSTQSDHPDQCFSYKLIVQAAQLKTQFPNQVHYLLGNHAMCQVIQDEVLKGGKPMVRSFNFGILNSFGQNGNIVSEAFNQFILSMPLAVKTTNRIWMSHTVPIERHLKDFDDNIFTKRLTISDLHNCPSLRSFIWDRRQKAQCIENLCQRWDVDLFITGHQPQETGHVLLYDKLIILASDHAHGSILPFNLSISYTPQQLYSQVKQLASIK